MDTKYLRLRYDHKRTRIKLPGSTKYLRLWYDQKKKIVQPGLNYLVEICEIKDRSIAAC